MAISVTSVTPDAAQLFFSASVMRREAPAMSGLPSARLEQNSFRPPPDPMLSTTGVSKAPPRPNCSDAIDTNGATVEELAIWMRSAAVAGKASVAASKSPTV